MKFSVIFLALAAGALAEVELRNATTITRTAYTTYCPKPTTITCGDKIVTVVAAAATVTIPNCDCTETKKPKTVTNTSCYPTHTDRPPPPHTETRRPDTRTHDVGPFTIVTPTTGDRTTARAAQTSYPAEFTGAAESNRAGGFIAVAIAGVAAFAL